MNETRILAKRGDGSRVSFFMAETAEPSEAAEKVVTFNEISITLIHFFRNSIFLSILFKKMVVI